MFNSLFARLMWAKMVVSTTFSRELCDFIACSSSLIYLHCFVTRNIDTNKNNNVTLQPDKLVTTWTLVKILSGEIHRACWLCKVNQS